MLKTKNEIKAWLDKYEIENYKINDDLTVDVMQEVKLCYQGLTEIPLQFGFVDGSFYCTNNSLESLKGSPYKVNGHFSCARNNLSNLIDAPQVTVGGFFCSDNPIISLTGFQTKIYHHFYQSVNVEKMPKIKELKDHYKKKHKTDNDMEVIFFAKDLKIILEHYCLSEEINKNLINQTIKKKKLKI